MKKLITTLAVASAMSTVFSGNAIAAEETVFGEGRTVLGAGSAAEVRGVAKQEALRDAVLKAIKDSTALDASADQFAPIVNELMKQVRDVRVVSEDAVGGEFVTRVEMSIDRKAMKNAIRGTDLDKLNDRSFNMLLLIDEYVSSSRDLNLPLESLEEFKYDAGTSFKDNSVKASSTKSSASSSAAASSSYNAKASENSKVNASRNSAASYSGSGGGMSENAAAAESAKYSGSASASASVNQKQAFATGSSAKSSSSFADAKAVSAKSHESVSYKKLVKYQDTSKPTNTPKFLNEFTGRVRDMDLRVMDSSVVRSKFFGNKQVTLAALQSSEEMAKFNDAARKANADFLVIGSSSVIQGDVNSATGQISCSVSVEIKAFATAGGELIAGLAENAQASGPNIEACSAIATQKVARMVAPGFGSNVLGYWADRAARGRQYIVELKGTSMPLPLRLAFGKGLREIPGIGDVEKKDDSPESIKYTITIKGKGDAMEQIYGSVAAQPAFAVKTLDGKSEGELITLCLDTCAEKKGKKK